MPTLVILILGSLLANSQLQIPPLSEKQAVIGAQTVLASNLDAALPSSPFEDWFREVVGSEAGVTWQLNECGGDPAMLITQGRDLPACAEVDALLPDNRKVVVMIQVGTFKKGFSGNPEFFHAAIELRGELYQVERLHQLPARLGSESIPEEKKSVKLRAHQPAPGAKVPDLVVRAGGEPSSPPPPPGSMATSSIPLSLSVENAPGGGAKVSESALLDLAISKSQPIYPANAKRANISGPVRVQITISVDGRVIDAVAVSGHPLLRGAAIAAAGKWVFEPVRLNGVPVQAEGILTFLFMQD
ncbi:MAG: TonB family protein [Acidobacteria bacterium]|nr:TonB family protein [Acidobacteriota bacterium]